MFNFIAKPHVIHYVRLQLQSLLNPTLVMTKSQRVVTRKPIRYGIHSIRRSLSYRNIVTHNRQIPMVDIYIRYISTCIHEYSW